MTEADSVFVYNTGESHVQFSEFEKIVELYKKGEAIAGANEDELNSILKQLAEDRLDYSNNTVIDMIIKRVSNNCDDKLKSLLDNLRIADNENVPSLGKAYQKYWDGSCFIEVDRNYLKRIRLLSDYLAVLSIIWETSEKEETIDESKAAKGEPEYTDNQKRILEIFKNIALERFTEDNEDTKAYNEFLRALIYYEKFAGEDITDDFVFRSNNIYEAAVAVFVGHEIGHHYYGHTDKKDKEQAKKRIEEEYNIDDTRQMQFLEYQADEFGTNFALDYICSQYGKLTNSVGIHQLVGIFVPMIVSIYSNGIDIFDDDKKHPSLLKRLVKVKWTLSHRTNTETLDEVMDYINHLLDILGINERIEEFSGINGGC